MADEMKNAQEKRFLHELDSTIANAKKEQEHSMGTSLLCTYNLLTYFCQMVSAGRVPDKRIIDFVIGLLLREETDLHKNKRERNSVLKKNIGWKQRRHTVSSIVQWMKDNERCFLSCGRVLAIYYGQADPATQLFELGQQSPTNEQLKAVVPLVEKIRARLLRTSGKKLRSQLGLKGYGWWRSKSDLHEEVTQEVALLRRRGLNQKEANKACSKRMNLSIARVKKIVQRKGTTRGKNST